MVYKVTRAYWQNTGMNENDRSIAAVYLSDSTYTFQVMAVTTLATIMPTVALSNCVRHRNSNWFRPTV